MLAQRSHRRSRTPPRRRPTPRFRKTDCQSDRPNAARSCGWRLHSDVTRSSPAHCRVAGSSPQIRPDGRFRSLTPSLAVRYHQPQRGHVVAAAVSRGLSHPIPRLFAREGSFVGRRQSQVGNNRCTPDLTRSSDLRPWHAALRVIRGRTTDRSRQRAQQRADRLARKGSAIWPSTHILDASTSIVATITRSFVPSPSGKRRLPRHRIRSRRRCRSTPASPSCSRASSIIPGLSVSPLRPGWLQSE